MKRRSERRKNHSSFPPLFDPLPNKKNDGSRFFFLYSLRGGDCCSPGRGSRFCFCFCCVSHDRLCCSGSQARRQAPCVQAQALRGINLHLDHRRKGDRRARHLARPWTASDHRLRQRRGCALLQDRRARRRASGPAQGAGGARPQGRHDSAAVSFFSFIDTISISKALPFFPPSKNTTDPYAFLSPTPRAKHI